VNGKAVTETAELFELASRMMEAAPPIRGGSKPALDAAPPIREGSKQAPRDIAA